VPISASQDSPGRQDSPGPMARTVDDVALLLEVLMGRTGIVERVDQGIPACISELPVPGAPATRHRRPLRLDHRAPGGGGGDGARRGRLPPYPGDQGPQDLAEVIAYEKHHAAVELAHFGHELSSGRRTGRQRTDAYRSARARNLAWLWAPAWSRRLPASTPSARPTARP